MAAAFYELCNQAHESNIRRGIHSAISSSDSEDSNSVSSSDAKPGHLQSDMTPRTRSKESHQITNKSWNKSLNLNSEYKEQDDEDGDMCESGVIHANMSRKRKSPERYMNNEEISNGNHFGNLGVELQTLKRQLSLKHASSSRATK